jgi:hypothetical protein
MRIRSLSPGAPRLSVGGGPRKGHIGCHGHTHSRPRHRDLSPGAVTQPRRQGLLPHRGSHTLDITHSPPTPSPRHVPLGRLSFGFSGSATRLRPLAWVQGAPHRSHPRQGEALCRASEPRAGVPHPQSAQLRHPQCGGSTPLCLLSLLGPPPVPTVPAHLWALSQGLCHGGGGVGEGKGTVRRTARGCRARTQAAGEERGGELTAAVPG